MTTDFAPWRATALASLGSFSSASSGGGEVELHAGRPRPGGAPCASGAPRDSPRGGRPTIRRAASSCSAALGSGVGGVDMVGSPSGFRGLQAGVWSICCGVGPCCRLHYFWANRPSNLSRAGRTPARGPWTASSLQPSHAASGSTGYGIPVKAIQPFSDGGPDSVLIVVLLSFGPLRQKIPQAGRRTAKFAVALPEVRWRQPGDSTPR